MLTRKLTLDESAFLSEDERKPKEDNYKKHHFFGHKRFHSPQEDRTFSEEEIKEKEKELKYERSKEHPDFDKINRLKQELKPYWKKRKEIYQSQHEELIESLGVLSDRKIIWAKV